MDASINCIELAGNQIDWLKHDIIFVEDQNNGSNTFYLL